MVFFCLFVFCFVLFFDTMDIILLRVCVCFVPFFYYLNPKDHSWLHLDLFKSVYHFKKNCYRVSQLLGRTEYKMATQKEGQKTLRARMGVV